MGENATSYQPRVIVPLTTAKAPCGLKVYTISASGAPVDCAVYWSRLRAVIREQGWNGAKNPGFALFHDGATMPYLVVARWGNGNELFTSVSVFVDGQWMEDPLRYSFCVWDMEVFAHERSSFLQHIYKPEPDIEAYRADMMAGKGSAPTSA